MSTSNRKLSKSATPAPDDPALSRTLSQGLSSYPLGVLDLRELVHVLRRQAWLVATVVAMGVGLALLYVLLAAPEFSATARLLIDTRGQKILEADQVSPALDSEIGTIESQVEILRSRRIAERVYEQAADERAALSPAREASSSPIEEKNIREFMRHMDVERVGLSYIIDVSFRDKDPNRAARIANMLADYYMADQLAVKVKATKDAVERLRSRFEKTSEEFRTVELRVQQFRSEHGLVSIEEMQTAGQREILDQMEQLAEMRGKLDKSEADLHHMQQLAATPDQLGGSVGDPNIAKEIAELVGQKTAAQRRLAVLLNQGDDSDPAITQLRAELETVERGLDEEVDRLEEVTRNDVELARKEVVLHEQRIKELKAEYAERDLEALELAELERKAEAARELYTSVLKRLKETEAQETLQTPDARVIAYAASPFDPAKPKKKLILALSFFGSLLIGVGGALAKDNLFRLRRSR